MSCYQYYQTSCKAIPDPCPSGYTEYSKDACCLTNACLIKSGRTRTCQRPCSTNISCCATGVAPAGYICDPNLLNLTSQCNSNMQTYCTPDRLFTDNRCITWCNNNSIVCNNLKKSICNTPGAINNPGCRNWCIDNPGSCELSANSYCANGNSNAFCACINSPLNNKDIFDQEGAPECFDKKCINVGAYKTLGGMNIVKSGCPDILKCNQSITIDSNTVDINKIDQSCKLSDKKNKDNGGNNKIPDNTIPPDDTDNSSFFSFNMIMLFVFILFIAIIIFAAYKKYKPLPKYTL